MLLLLLLLLVLLVLLLCARTRARLDQVSGWKTEEGGDHTVSLYDAVTRAFVRRLGRGSGLGKGMGFGCSAALRCVGFLACAR